MITFTNRSSKIWLARRGPSKVFGNDVDRREKLSVVEAVRLFDRVWAALLRDAITKAPRCEAEQVAAKLRPSSDAYFNKEAEHREFWLRGCLLIAQLPEPDAVDQLWYVTSSSGDPRGLFVRFPSVSSREAFVAAARRFGFEPNELASALLIDYVGSHGQAAIEDHDHEAVGEDQSSSWTVPFVGTQHDPEEQES